MKVLYYATFSPRFEAKRFQNLHNNKSRIKMNQVNIYAVIKAYHGYRVKPELGTALKVRHEESNRYIYLDIQYTLTMYIDNTLARYYNGIRCM